LTSNVGLYTAPFCPLNRPGANHSPWERRQHPANCGNGVRFYRVLKQAGSALALLGLFATATATAQTQPQVRIDLNQAIQMALLHNHQLNADRTLIQQAQANQTTASLRPNPVFTTDALFVPFFSPNALNSSTLNNITEFDAGVAYTIERGHKRQARMHAARDQTTLTTTQVADEERVLTFNVAQQFIQVLLAKSTLQFAQRDLQSFQNTLNISQEQYKAGQISEGDYLKTKLQLLQFQTDVSATKVQLVQALHDLRQLIGFNALPANYDVIGKFSYASSNYNLQDLEAQALQRRRDLLAAKQGVTAAQSQYALARANGKRNLTAQMNYTHVSALNNASLFATIEIPVFDRNQGEIARTHYAITQSQEVQQAVGDQVMTDVQNAYAALQTNSQVVQLYDSGYLKEAQESRDISEYAYRRGAASLLDFLDAERSYRSTQLAYRQALAAYMVALEQLKEAVGARHLR